MKKDSITDYSACILFRLLGPIIRSMPNELALFLGRRLGDLFYYFDFKHKAIAYANIKTALADKVSVSQLSCITKGFYHNFGQSLIEIFIIPLINKEYLDKYISIEGIDYVTEGFRRGKGLILVGMHEGSWELSNIICANLGFPFVLFVRNQRYPALNRLLNSYRIARGCKIIQRKNQLDEQNKFFVTRQLLEVIKNNEAIGMNVDQGGKTGMLVKFFGKDASMPQGAIRLALKYDATLIPVFYKRINGPKIKVIIEPPFEIKRTGDFQNDIHNNLQRLVRIFEGYILKYPEEYLWTYKIYKYGRQKNILILSDGKTGHLRQAQAVAKIVKSYLEEKAIKTQVDTIEIKFNDRFSRLMLILSSCLSGKYHCQGCLWCLKTFLPMDVYKSLVSIKPDVVISCGSSVAAVNFILSRDNLAKSIVIMRPSILSTQRFDLVIMPHHDTPPKRKNVVITEGALNLIDDDYLKVQSKELSSSFSITHSSFIGLLIGGDAKNFRLDKEIMLEVIQQIKSASKKLDRDILVTTSRRTPKEIEELAKEEFRAHPQCKFLVIANEKNIRVAVGAILGLSQLIITSPESISMISEAASSGKYVLVFKSQVTLKHKRFLNYMAKKQYIYLCQPYELASLIEKLYQEHPAINTLNDKTIIKQALDRIF